jgi:glyoxylase-like metal-dependent hydrolase (beta-lactamase superfamily II)
MANQHVPRPAASQQPDGALSPHVARMLPLRAFAARITARILPSLSVATLAAAVGLSGCALTASGARQRVAAPQQLAPGVFAVIGQTADPTSANHGAVGNQGILIGDDGVILVDTGTSQRYATELIETVRQLTPKPIVLAIDTHQHPAFIFGNGALASQGVPILAHHEVADLIEQRCDKCLKNLNSILGTDEMAGTRVTVPTRIIEGATTMKVAGRVIDILYLGQTSSPGSIAVFDRASGVLFAGGMVSIGRIPDTKDANIDAWLAALQTLKGNKIAMMVPGEGPVSPVARVDELAAYLRALKSTVEATYAKGISLGDAGVHSELPAFAAVPLYRPAHNKNVEQLYLKLERATLNTQ